MNSKERVKKAIRFEGVDRVPHYLPDSKENDLIWAAPWNLGGNPGLVEKQPWQITEGGNFQEMVDAWSVTWRRHIDDTGKGEAKKYPITDITQQGEYEFPNANHPDYFRKIQEVVEKNNTSENPKYILGVAPFSSLNEGTHIIRGLNNMFMDYYSNPDDLKGLIVRLAEKQAESIRLLADAGCDGVMFYDDWGLQDRLMVSPDLIEELFMPHYRANWDWLKSLVWIHGCIAAGI